ncbi:DUF6252 family protein [Hymenobacter sp.]|uniref:DUF6252 family protein n=1 Tax=Hymenobacter sp. TaxID=1898978 RepID=UPI00286C13CA|nr:DUF6252 family protein [Hymenobacter sp.]
MLLRFRYFRTLAALAAITSLGACSKDDPKPNPTDAVGMSWTVDGTNVTANTAVAQASGNDVIIGGATSATGGVFLEVPKTAGTYTLTSMSAQSASYVVTPTQGASKIYDSTSGSIVVSSVSATNIIGTFTFTGTESGGTATKTLTNGKFNVKL